MQTIHICPQITIEETTITKSKFANCVNIMVQVNSPGYDAAIALKEDRQQLEITVEYSTSNEEVTECKSIQAWEVREGGAGRVELLPLFNMLDLTDALIDSIGWADEYAKVNEREEEHVEIDR